MTDFPWINHILNNASEQLLAWEESGQFASELHVHSSVFRSLQHLRKRELENGLPLIVLGTTVVQDDTLASHEILVVP